MKMKKLALLSAPLLVGLSWSFWGKAMGNDWSVAFESGGGVGLILLAGVLLVLAFGDLK